MGKVKDTATSWPPNAEDTTKPTLSSSPPKDTTIVPDKTVQQLTRLWGGGFQPQQQIQWIVNARGEFEPIFSISQPGTPNSFPDYSPQPSSPFDSSNCSVTSDSNEDSLSMSTNTSEASEELHLLNIPIPPVPPPSALTKPTPLTPLSGGGFIYHYSPVANPGQSQFVPLQPYSLPVDHLTPFLSTMTKVQPNIADRQVKLEKYRQKRLKRNFIREADPVRSERAQARIRNDKGHFITEKIGKYESEREKMVGDLHDVKRELTMSKTESQALRARLSAVERELDLLRHATMQASESQRMMRQRLEEQQHINEKLLKENRVLWSTVPSKQVFNSYNPSLSPVFSEKIDLNEKISSLNTVNSTAFVNLDVSPIPPSDFNFFGSPTDS